MASPTDALVNAGDELAVPVAIALAMPHPLHYVTRVGDTLVTVADRFNVSVEDLRRWNHLSSSRIQPRRSLYVSQPIHLAPAATEAFEEFARESRCQGETTCRA